MGWPNHARIFHLQLQLLSLFVILLLFNQTVSSELCNPHDKTILLQIKTRLGNPSSLGSWDPNTDCCNDWYSFTTPQITCDDQGHVIGLWLSSADDISIDILPALGDLPYLEYLKLDFISSLSNPIPTSVCSKFKKLWFLTIMSCDIYGPIPDCLSQIPNLKHLDLSYNKLSGQIPTTLGRIRNLLSLGLNDNKLSGSIPEFLNSRTSMYSLSVVSNQLSGSIPEHLGLMSNLSELFLSHNQFNGSIPASLGYVGSLRWLDLSSNQLTGPIPESFGSLTDSIILRLNDNRLTGQLPKSMSRFNPMELNLARNYNLTGDALFLFASYKSWITNVDISHNRFKFNITDLDPPRELESLNISHNKIYGSFPVKLGFQLPDFSIDVSYNKLRGRIPSGWENFDPIYFSHNKCLCGPPLAAC